MYQSKCSICLLKKDMYMYIYITHTHGNKYTCTEVLALRTVARNKTGAMCTAVNKGKDAS